MKRASMRGVVLASVLATALVACGSTNAPTANQQSTTTSAPTSAPTTAATNQSGPVISGEGQIASARDVNLVFTVQGVVADVKVKEGDTVKQGDLLAILDTRPFDERVDQAQAALEVAQAQEQMLNEGPKAAAISGANAQIQAAQVAVAQAQIGQTQDIKTAQANLVAAQTNLQNTRDKLSAAKTQADTAVTQTGETLVQAQAAYAQAKSNWDYVQSTNKNPVQPTTVNSQGKPVANKVTDAQREQYYAVYVQSEAALRNVEQQVQQAQVSANTAHQAEITGDQAAEQLVVQAQAALDKLRVPANVDRVAAARAQLAQAQAGRAQLNPAPEEGQVAQAQGNIHVAQAALNQAKLNREYAELHAPFDATVSVVNIDVGEAAGTAGTGAAIRLIDTNALRFEVQVNDADIGQVHIGQSAEVHLDALPDQTVTGKVSYIAPEATTAGTTRTFLVRIALDKQDGLHIGMSGQVNFLR